MKYYTMIDKNGTRISISVSNTVDPYWLLALYLGLKRVNFIQFILFHNRFYNWLKRVFK
jgi:hypothetical protein